MIGKRRFLAVYVPLLAAGIYLHLHKDLSVPAPIPLDRFPCAVDQWRMTGESQLSGEVQTVLRASAVLLRQYVNRQGQTVELYIGYHDGGDRSGEIHSPKHCLPGSGWLKESSARLQIPAAGNKLNLVKAVYQKGDSRTLFLYWFQVRGKSISEEYALKAAEIANSVLSQRRDASLIRVSIPIRASEQQAAAIGERFIGDVLPSIRAFLPR